MHDRRGALALSTQSGTTHNPVPCYELASADQSRPSWSQVESSTLPAGSGREGVYCRGRVGGFELVGERGTKVPNLTIGQGDVEANVYVRFVFEYSKYVAAA